MTKVLVTGSTTGLGLRTVETLMRAGHRVILHARNAARAKDVGDLLDRGAELVTGDLGDPEQVVALAAAANGIGSIDAVVHNAGVIDGAALPAVNVVAPYLLTAILPGVRRHVYLSSSMHRAGHPQLSGLDRAEGEGTMTYSDSKLLVTALALGVARVRPDLLVHAVDPGWVPTRMGGPSAPDDLQLGVDTQVLLATAGPRLIGASGGYWHHGRREEPSESARDRLLQDGLLEKLSRRTGVDLP